MYLFFHISSTQSCSFSSIVSLPLSLYFDSSPTLSSYVPLWNHYYLSLSMSISCSISLLLSVSLLFCYSFSISPSLSVAFSLFGATSDYASLYDCDIIPLLPPFLLWYDYHHYCFVFVLKIIISLLVLLLANMKMNILEKSLFSIFIKFFIFLYFFIFLFLYLL